MGTDTSALNDGPLPFNQKSGLSNSGIITSFECFSFPPENYDTSNYTYTFAVSGYYNVGWNLNMGDGSNPGNRANNWIYIERKKVNTTNFHHVLIGGAMLDRNETRSCVGYFDAGDVIRLSYVSSHSADRLNFAAGQYSQFYAFKMSPENTSVTSSTMILAPRRPTQ